MMVIGGCLFVLPFAAILFVMISDTPSERTAKVPTAFIGGFIGFVLFAAAELCVTSPQTNLSNHLKIPLRKMKSLLEYYWILFFLLQ
jgi:uncharacterized BrkB/YihY/UPF0761 family membrane protein